MKRQWQTEELVEQFTLLPDEMALLDNKVGVNRLGESSPAQVLPTRSQISTFQAGDSEADRLLYCQTA
jgi:hypothetical protein